MHNDDSKEDSELIDLRHMQLGAGAQRAAAVRRPSRGKFQLAPQRRRDPAAWPVTMQAG
jgi:hypothetical protein